MTSIWSRISRFKSELPETKQDWDLKKEDLEKGKETIIPNSDIANQEGNKNINIHEIEKIKNILLYSDNMECIFITLYITTRTMTLYLRNGERSQTVQILRKYRHCSSFFSWYSFVSKICSVYVFWGEERRDAAILFSSPTARSAEGLLQ